MTTEGQMRRCKQCGEEKPLDQFNRSGGWKGTVYYRSVCKLCHRPINAAQRAAALIPKIQPPALPEGYLRCSRCKQPLPATPEFFWRDDYKKSGFASACKGCISTQKKNARAENPEPERAWHRKYNALHREQTRLYRKRWEAKNPHRNRIKHARRRVRQVAAGGSFTKEDIQLAYRSQKGLCWHCGKPLGDDYHADHLHPVSKGGSSDPRNMVLSCPFCNQSKHDKTTIEWNGKLF